MKTEDVLKLFGFNKSGSCNCGGIRNEKYKKGKYVCYVRPGKSTFKIKEKNSIIEPFQPLSDLMNSLSKIFPDVAVEEKV